MRTDLLIHTEIVLLPPPPTISRLRTFACDVMTSPVPYVVRIGPRLRLKQHPSALGSMSSLYCSGGRSVLIPARIGTQPRFCQARDALRGKRFFH